MMNGQLQEFQRSGAASCARSPARHGRKGRAEPARGEEGAGEGAIAAARQARLGPGYRSRLAGGRREGRKVLAASLDGADAKSLREAMDKLKDRLKSAAIVLGAVNDGKVSLIAGVTADLTGKVKAGELVNYVAQQVGGKGGGRPDMAQAGGTEPAKLPAALESVKSWVEQRV